MIIAGVDEVGRGPLVGEVVAAAVILPLEEGVTFLPGIDISAIKDSKVLTAKKREQLFEKICEHAIAWHIASATVEEIDRINISQAGLLAMQRAVAGLKVKPTKVLVDGNQRPKVPYPVEAIIGGDAFIPQISAASILAKVYRDRQMVELDKIYPAYGFAKHKGYGTAEHLAALKQHGPIDLHRRSFAPVRTALSIVEEC